MIKVYFSILIGFMSLHLSAQVSLKHPEKVFDFLVGTWQYGTNPEFETWAKVGNRYTAEIYSLANVDTIRSQQLTIMKENKNYILEQRVILQPNLPRIQYQLTEASSEKFVFENKKESFPQTIIYEFSGNSLKISQGGKINGKPQSISFIYIRYNK